MISNEPRVVEHAEEIMRLIDEDIRDGRVPVSVTSLAEIGEYVEGYVTAENVPDTDPAYHDHMIRVIENVEWRLRMRRLRDQDRPPWPTRDEPVDIRLLAELLGVEIATVHMWRWRTGKGQLPEPMPEADHSLSRPTHPIWRASTIRTWARRAGRLTK